MKHSRRDNENRENWREKVIRYKRIIIQLIVIIVGITLILVFLLALKEQKDIQISLISSAAGIIAGSVISLADFCFLRDDVESKKEKEISELKSEVEILRGISNGTKGIKIYRNRNDISFTNFIESASEEICMYMTNLDFLTNHYRALFEAARRGVKVKILAIKPTNLFIATRYHELGKKEPKAFFGEIKVHLEQLRDELLIKNDVLVKENFKVRLYLGQPTHMLFKFDNKLILSFILRQGRARERMHIEFDLQVPAMKVVEKNFIVDFNMVWDESFEFTYELFNDLPETYNTTSMEALGKDRTIKTYRLN